MNLNECLTRAQQAARTGDLDRLEIELAQLRRLPEGSIRRVDANLRAVARSVRSHPSFRSVAHAKAV